MKSLFTYPYLITNQYGVFFSWNTKEEFIVHYLNSNDLEFTHESIYRFSLIQSSQKELKTTFYF